MMVNKRPVLIYQTRLAPIRVIVTISDIHLRDALYSDTDDNGLALWVQNQMIARYGDVKPLAADPHQEVFTSPAYSFRIAYPESLLFSLARLVNNVSGLLIFIFSVSLLFYFLMRKYLNVYTSEEEKLRYAITQGYIVPYYQPLVNGKTWEAPTSKLLDCVIEMARTLSLRIIAEGVETEAQRDYLNRQNIHLLQGYYFWKPMPYVALVMLLLEQTEGADCRRISGRCEKSCHATGYVSVSAVGMKTSSVAVRVMHDRPDKARRGYLSVTPSLVWRKRRDSNSGTLSGRRVFKTGAFNRSATLPV